MTLPWSGLPPRLVLVGVGAGRPADLRRAGAALARSTRGLRRVVTTLGAEAPRTTPPPPRRRAPSRRATCSPPTSRRRRPPRTRPARGAAELVLLGRDGMRPAAAVAEGHTAATATWLVRDLATTPSSTKTPAWLADQAKRLATKAGLEVTVRSPRELAAEGFGGILAVGAGLGVVAPAGHRRVHAHERRRQARRRRRQGDHLRHGRHLDQAARGHGPHEDRHDRCRRRAGHGARCRRRGVAHRVTAVLPLAENHFGGASYRPGDVLTMWGGTTVEIANTDAEGRLVLADALAWADATLDPDVLIDVATLTGAATLGLGKQHAALYSADDELVDRPRGGRRRVRRAGLAHAAGRGVRGGRALRRRRPAARARRQAHRRRVDHRGAVPAALRRARGPGRTSTSPGPPARPPTSTRSPRVRPASAPASCCGTSTTCAERAPPRDGSRHGTGRPEVRTGSSCSPRRTPSRTVPGRGTACSGCRCRRTA